MPPLTPAQHEALSQTLPNLKLLALFGSRAKGTATAKSDWDLAFLAKPNPIGWAELELQESIAQILEISSDQIDLVNLTHCSPVLGYVVAKEGKVLYESEPNQFIYFQMKAWKIYADTAKLRQYQAQYIRESIERLQQ